MDGSPSANKGLLNIGEGDPNLKTISQNETINVDGLPERQTEV